MKSKKYLKRIDCLKIISCIFVLLFHLNVVKGGFLVVCTFFALSGYLDCYFSLSKNEFSIKEYYINKLKRIYLPLTIVVFSTLIVYKFYPVANWINLKQETNSVLLGYNNFWQINANLDYFTRNVNSPFTHFWYIAILMQFELVFPWLFVLFKKIKEKTSKNFIFSIVFIITLIFTTLFAVMSYTQNTMLVYYSTISRIFSMLLGTLLAIMHYEYNFRLTNLTGVFSKVIYYINNILLIVLCFVISSSTNNYAIFMLIVSILSIIIIDYASKSVKLKESKLIKNFSKITYEIYLLQYPVIYFLQNIKYNSYIKITLAIIITFILSILLNIFIDNILKKRFSIGKLLCPIIIVFGIVILFSQKNYNEEMKQLQDLINENTKIAEEKNKEFLNNKSNLEEEAQELQIETEEKIQENLDEIIENKIKELPIMGIGDSVLLGAVDKLYKKFPNGYFDGQVSRTIVGGTKIINDLKAQGRLGNTLLFTLANNGDPFIYRFKAFVNAVEGREVFWINSYGADDPQFNDIFKDFAKDYPNIYIIDWYSASYNHPEYFCPDGVHLQTPGVEAYVNLIYDSIYNKYLEDLKNN